MKKAKIFNLIISIAAPILLVTAVIIVISYGWYVRKQQIATIDANAKSLAVDYTFDDDTTKDRITYEVHNLVFFDNNSEFEYPYLNGMKVELSVTLTNKSTNPVTYKLTFDSEKTKKEENGAAISIAYVDCIFTSIPTATTTIKTIDTARNNSSTIIPAVGTEPAKQTNVITYSDSSTNRTASYSSGDVTLAPNETIEAPIVLCLFGVQEIDTAKSDDFLYEISNNQRVLSNAFSFTLIIESVPVGEAIPVENEDEPTPSSGD